MVLTFLLCLIWANIYSSDAADTWTSFTTSSNGWSGYTPYSCGGTWLSGNHDQNVVLEATRTYTRVPYRFDYSFSLYMIATVDLGDYFRFYINNNILEEFDRSASFVTYIGTPCSTAYVATISKTVTTSPPVYSGLTYTFKFTNGLNSQGYDETWGVNGFVITAFMCDPSCDTCSGEANNECTSCVTNMYQYTGGGGMQCVASCPALGAYCAVSGVCTPCTNPQCLACGPPSYCTSCNTAGYYLSSDHDCLPCFWSCATCSDGSSTSCTSCPADRYEYLPSGGKFQCVYPCPLRYATVGTQCIACTDSHCIRCSPQSTCSLCDDGFYVTGSNTCGTCHASCATCINGLATGCSSCNSGYYQYLKQSDGTFQCITTCPTSYVAVNGICMPCNDPNCLSCSAPDFCTSCSSGYFLNVNLTCVNCDTSCSSCVTETPGGCTACATGLIKRRVLPTSTGPIFFCVATCPDGYAVVAGVCTACSVYGCQLCPTSPSQCTQCQSGYLLSQNTCLSPINMEPIGVIGDKTAIIGFNEAFFYMLTEDSMSYFSISVQGLAASDFTYTLSKSSDNQTFNLTFNFLTTVPPGARLAVEYNSAKLASMNSSVQDLGFYLNNSNVFLTLSKFTWTDVTFPQIVADISNIGGPIAAAFYLLSMTATYEGSLILGASTSLEIILLNRAVNLEFPDNMVTIFKNSYMPPIPFLLPLTLELFGLDPHTVNNTLPSASNLEAYFNNANFIDNTARDLFTLIILMIIYLFMLLILRLLRDASEIHKAPFQRIKTFIGWNLTIVVTLSASLRSSFFIFLNMTFPSLQEVFGVFSLIFSSIVIAMWFIYLSAIIVYVNRKKVWRMVGGRITKKVWKRGRFDVLYEEFLETKHIRKFYMPMFILRNLLLGAVYSSMWQYPLIQAVLGVMINFAFMIFVITARPWNHSVKLVIHVLFDIGVVMISTLMLAFSIIVEQGLWTYEIGHLIGNIFVMTNLVMLLMNFVLSFLLLVRTVWKLFRESTNARTSAAVMPVVDASKIQRPVITDEKNNKMSEPDFKKPKIVPQNESGYIEDVSITPLDNVRVEGVQDATRFEISRVEGVHNNNDSTVDPPEVLLARTNTPDLSEKGSMASNKTNMNQVLEAFVAKRKPGQNPFRSTAR